MHPSRMPGLSFRFRDLYKTRLSTSYTGGHGVRREEEVCEKHFVLAAVSREHDTF